jgi:Helix-turn-helix domain
VEHRKTDVRSAAGRAASADDAARFLNELRQLRSGAGLGHAELAARAHYPYDSIRAAEVGPSLPDLPVLSAFVRGCGGTAEEWEERWRSLTKSPSLPVSAARQSGRSDAASAGARISSDAVGDDGPDPSIIIAALNRVAEEMATPGDDEPPVPPAAVPSAEFPSSSPRPEDPMPLPGDQVENENKAAAGWDPIRVSSAWPVLKHTPTVAEPRRPDAAAGGAGVPWDAAPWAEAPPGGPSGGPATAGPSGQPTAAGRSRRTAVLVTVGLVVLCLLIAVLAFVA